MPAIRTITRIKICGNRPFFSVGPMELFEKIETYSSIKKATEAMGMSYTKALRIIRTVEEELGFPVVLSEKGGNSRGATRLTEKGRQVLAAFREIYTGVSEYAEKLVNKKFRF
jgi:molybdate transport system regulatory protein